MSLFLILNEALEGRRLCQVKLEYLRMALQKKVTILVLFCAVIASSLSDDTKEDEVTKEAAVAADDEAAEPILA